MLRFANRNIIIFALTDMIGNLARSMVFPYFSLYILALGGTAEQIGFVSLLTQVAGLMLLPVAGKIADRTHRIHILAFAGYLSAAFQVINVVALDWRWLAVAGLLSGWVVISFPAYSSLIADSLQTSGRGRSVAVMNMISTSLMIVGPFIAGSALSRMGTVTGMRILFVFMVAATLVGTTIQILFVREPADPSRGKLNLTRVFESLRTAYRNIPSLVKGMSPALRALTLVILASFIAQALSGAFWVVYATEIQGLSASQWGLILLIESLIKWLLLYPAGMLTDLKGRQWVLTIALLIFALSCPAFWLARGFGWVLAVRVIQSLAYVMALPACIALMADLVPRVVRGEMMAAMGNGGIMLGVAGNPGGPAVGYLMIPGIMIAALASGYLYNANPILPWVGSAIVALAAVILTAVFVRDPHEAQI